MRYHIPKHYSSKEVEEKVDKGKEADESEHTSRSSPRSGAPTASSSSVSSQLEINLTQKQCNELEDRIKELGGKVIGIGYDRLRNCIYIQVGTATEDRSDTHIFVIDAASSQIKYYVHPSAPLSQGECHPWTNNELTGGCRHLLQQDRLCLWAGSRLSLRGSIKGRFLLAGAHEQLHTSTTEEKEKEKLEDHYPSIVIELDPVEARQLHRTLSGLSSTLSSSLETNQGNEVKSILKQLQDFFSLTDSADSDTQIPLPPTLDSSLLPPDSPSPLSPYPTSNMKEVTPTPTEEPQTTTAIAEEEQVASIIPPETLSSSVSEIRVSLPPSPSSLHSEKWTTCVIKAEKLHLAGLIDSIFVEQEEKMNPRPDEGLSILEHISDQLRYAKPYVLRLSRSKEDISALRSKQGHRIPPPVTNLLSFPSVSPPRKPSINSELVRLRTFLNNWPHPEYQYATPNKLAEAGFFLQPADTFPDRCFCFSCSIALVSWEPADDPWTEHKRHAPSCAFISGKPTLNIPLSVTLGKAGSIEHPISDNTQLNEPISLVAIHEESDLLATATESGSVTIWNIQHEPIAAPTFWIWPEVKTSPQLATYLESNMQKMQLLYLDFLGTKATSILLLAAISDETLGLVYCQQVLPNPEDEGYLEPEYLKFDHSITSIATFASSKTLVIAGYDTKTSQVLLKRYKWNETSSSSSLLFNDPTEVVLPLEIIKSPLKKLSFINCDESGEYLIALTESNWIFLFDAKKLEVITSVQFHGGELVDYTYCQNFNQICVADKDGHLDFIQLEVLENYPQADPTATVVSQEEQEGSASLTLQQLIRYRDLIQSDEIDVFCVSPSGAKPINATSSGEETPDHPVGQLGKYGKQWQIAREAFSIVPRSPVNNLSASTQGLPVFNNDALKPPSTPAINLRKSAESLKQSLQASASLAGDAFKVDQGAGVREMVFEFYMRQRYVLDRVEFEYEMEKECTALQQPQFFISLEHVDYSAREKDRGGLLSSGSGIDDSSSHLEQTKPTRDLIRPNINITLPLTGSGKKSNKLVLSTIQMAKTPTRALFFKLRYLFPGVISPLSALSNNLVRLISLRLYGRKYEGESSLQLRIFVLQNQDFHSKMVSSLLATETPPQLRLYLLDFLLSLAPVESIDESEPTMRHRFTEALISKTEEEEESVVMQFLRINLLEASNTVADKTHTLVRALLPVENIALLDAFWQAAIRLLPRASEISSPTGLRCYFDLLLRFFHERFDGVYSEVTEKNYLPEVLQTSLTLLQTLGQKIFSSMVHRELYPLISSLCGGDSTQLIFERGLFESFNPRTKLLLGVRNKEDLLSKDNEDFSPFDSETPIVTPDNEELDFKFMDSSRGASFDEEKKAIVFADLLGTRWAVLDFGSPAVFITWLHFPAISNMAQLCVEIWEDEVSSSKQEGDTSSQNSTPPFNDPKKPKTILTWTVNTSPIVHCVQKWCRYLRVSVFGTSQQSSRICIPSCVSGMRHHVSILSPTSGNISLFRWESLERSEKQRVLAEAEFRAHQQLLVQKLLEFRSRGSTLDFPREGRMREELRGLSDLREQVVRSQIYFNGIWRKSRKLRSLLYESLRESTLDEETAALGVIQEDINKDGAELRDATSISRWLTCCEGLSDFIQKLFAAVPSPVNEHFLPDSTTKIARSKIDSLFETFCLQQGPTKKLKKFIGDLIVLVGPLCGDTWDNFCSQVLQRHFDTPTPGISQKVHQEGFSILQAILNSDSRYKEQVFYIFELLKRTSNSPLTKAGFSSNSTAIVRLSRRQLSLIGWIFSLLLGLFVKKEAVTALPALPQELNPVKMVFDILNNLLVFSTQPALFVIASDVLIHLFGYYSLHIEEGFVNHPAFTDFFVSVLRSNNSILRNCLLRILESLTFSMHTQIRTTAISKIVTLLLQPNLLLNSRSTARKSNKPSGLSAEVLEILSIINPSSIDSQEHIDFLLSNLSGSSPKAWNLALRLLSSVNSLSLVNSDQLLAAAFRSMLLLPSTESSLVGPDILSFLSQLVFDESPVVSVTCQNLLVKEILLVSQQYIIPQLELSNQGQRYSDLNISFVMPLLGTVARALKKDQKTLVNTSPKDPLFGILPQVVDLLVKTIDDWLQTISFDSFFVLPTVRTELKNIPLIEGSESAIKEGDFGEVTYVENSKMSIFSRLIEFLHSILKFEEQTKRYWHYSERILCSENEGFLSRLLGSLGSLEQGTDMVSISLRQAITSIFCDFLTKSVSCSALSLLHKVIVSVLQTSYEEDGSAIPVTLLTVISTVLSDSAESLLSFVEAGGVRFAFDQLIELKRRRDFEDGEERCTIFDGNPSIFSAIESYTLKEQNDVTSSKVTTPPHRENEEVLKNFISGCSVLNVSSNTGMECETLAGLLPDWSVTYSSWDKYFAEDEEDFYFTLALPKDVIIHKIVVTMGIPYEFSPQKIVISTGRDSCCLSPVGVFPILYQPWLEVSFPRPELARVIRFGLTRSFNRRVSLSGIKILGVTAMESLISTLSNKQPAPGSETALPSALGSDFISLTRKVETILDLLCILLKNISKHSSATLTTSDKRIALESALSLLAKQISSLVDCEGEGERVSYYQQLQEILLSFGLSSNTLKKKAVQSFVLVTICAPDCSSAALESLLSSENRDNRKFVVQCLEPLCYIPSVSGRILPMVARFVFSRLGSPELQDSVDIIHGLVAIIQCQGKTSRRFLDGLIEADESILHSLATLATGDNFLQQAAEKLLISLLCILDTEGNYLSKLLARIGDLSSLTLDLKSKAVIMALATTTLNERSIRLLVEKGVFSTLLTQPCELFALVRKDPTLVIEQPKERLSTLAFFLKFFAKASHSIVVKDLLMTHGGGGTKFSFVEELFEFCDETLPNNFSYSSTLFEIYRESSSIIKNCCKAHRFYQEKVATSIVCALKKRLARVELETSPSPFLQSLLIALLSSNDKMFLTIKLPSASTSSASSPSLNFIGLDTFLERDPKPTVDYVQKLFRSSSILTEKRVRLLNSFVLKSMPEIGESSQPSSSGASPSSELQWECLWKLKSPGTGWGNFKEKCFMKGPTLLILRDTTGEVFGGFASVGFQDIQAPYGNSKCFIFNLDTETVFSPFYMDNLMVTDWEAGMSGIVWGSGDLYFTLDHSRSCSSHLYGYRCAEKPEARLTSSYTFVPLEVEVFALPTPFYKSASSTSSPKESGFTICATSPDNSDGIASKWLIEAHKQQRVYTVPLSQPLLVSTDLTSNSSLFAVRRGVVSSVSSEIEGPLASEESESADDFRVGPLNPSLALGTLRNWLISLSVGWKEGEEVLEFEYGPEAKQTELLPSESQYLDLEHPYTSAFKRQFAEEGGLGLLIGFANARLQHLKAELRGKESPRVVLDQLTLYQTIPHFAEVLFEHPQFLIFFLSYISDAARVYPRPSDTTLYSPSQVELINLMEEVLETTLVIFRKESSLRFLAFEQGVLGMIVSRLIELCNIKSTGSSSSSSTSTTATPSTSSLRKKLGKKDKENKKTYWEKGTGFGFGETTPAPMMEKEKLQAEQRRKDKSIAQLLRILSAFFDPHARIPSSSSSSTFSPNWTVVCDFVRTSGLVSVLETYLRNDSLLDMTTSQTSTSLYTSIFVLLRNLAGFPELLPLLELLPGQTTSLLSLLKQVSTQSQFLLKRLGTGNPAPPSSGAPVSVPPSSDLWATSLAEEIVSTFDQVGEKIVEEKKRQEQQKEEERERKECAEKQEKGQEQGKERGTKRKEEVESSTSTEKGKEPEVASSSSLLDLYVEVLKEQLFRSADMNVTDSKGDFGEHYYASTIKSETGTPCHSKMIRLVQEIGSLSTSLPLTPDSSIFVCCDDERLDVLKVLIIGPHPSTPYSSGCFLFHIYAPNTYPQTPPLVHLETTGGGTTRFNPNLYNCGKVCLSLLGTWPGEQDEMWNPKISTILQVLISILGLIFVPEPYFNEPGYERARGTPAGDDKNRAYNQTIRVATVQHAIVGQLKTPPVEFEEIIKTHFYLRREIIIAQVNEWLEEAKPYKHHHEALLKQQQAMLAEFAKLSKPNLILDYEKEHGIVSSPSSSSSSSSSFSAPSSTIEQPSSLHKKE